MASLFDIDASKPALRILDAGAGTGILSVALVSRLLDSYPGEIHLVCYETDENVLGLLRQNLAAIAEPRFSFEIRSENYLLSQEFCGDDLFRTEPAEQYDLIIGNPPYKKVPKELDEAKHMAAVCFGAPNLYFMFWAMGIQNLKDGCEMVYIVPRSWTSGAYFKAFRQYLLSRCSIISIHLFNSRDKVFDGEDVLQETMIIKIRKNQSHPQFLRMSCTENSDFSDLRIFDVPYSVVVPDNDYVFLVTNEKEADVLSKLNKFDSTLKSNGTPMKTGLIVDFRARDAIRSKAGENTEEFAPRFAPNSECLYVGDTTQKDMVKNVDKLAELGFDITLHDKMPDVVLYKEDKNWIYFIEAVDSVGPMSPARVLDINNMTKDVTAGKIFITAFLSVDKYKRFIDQLAWETEVWIAEMPDHMIHLNGNKFLGPR